MGLAEDRKNQNMALGGRLAAYLNTLAIAGPFGGQPRPVLPVEDVSV